MTVFDQLARNKILPATVVPKAEQAPLLAKALLAGGLDIMEVTLRNPDAPMAIQRICTEVGDMCCGAGTILNLQDLDTAMNAGAVFGLSPGFNPRVVKEAFHRNFPFIPGVCTPGEMEQALELGSPWVKFFPAEAAGGVPYLKAISAPYKHTELRLIPLGGISTDNLSDYLQLDMVPAVGGSWLGNAALLESGSYDRITKLTLEAVKISR